MVHFMIVVVLIMLCSFSSISAQMPNNIPPCVSKLSDCSTKAMQSTNLATGEMPCCSEWAKEIKDSTQCVCDNFKPYLSSLTDFFTLCKIDAPTCEGISFSFLSHQCISDVLVLISLSSFVFLCVFFFWVNNGCIY